MIKSKFKGRIKSKTYEGMVNDALCKVLCHNLVVLIHELNDANINIGSLFENDQMDFMSPFVCLSASEVFHQN